MFLKQAALNKQNLGLPRASGDVSATGFIENK
jgi:hypothetical protein